MKRIIGFDMCINRRCRARVGPRLWFCAPCRLVWRVGLFLGGFVVGAVITALKFAGKL